jgi:hypothetical protein
MAASSKRLIYGAEKHNAASVEMRSTPLRKTDRVPLSRLDGSIPQGTPPMQRNVALRTLILLDSCAAQAA